jgi:hypothetical protein
LTVLKGNIPDYVPVAPDFSNMIPARRTGRPFWDLYLYNNPPIWEAYIDCARHFGIDSVMDGYFPFRWPSDEVDPHPWETFIVSRDAGRESRGHDRNSQNLRQVLKIEPPTRGECVEASAIRVE